MTSRLSDRRLFIADMAMRLNGMETAEEPMHPLMYRVLAKRLRQALAGFTDHALAGRFGPLDAQVALSLEDRYFDDHGQLQSWQAADISRQARELFRRLGVQTLPHWHDVGPTGRA